MAGQRVALLVAVSEYGEGYQALPGTLHDLDLMERVLQDEEIGNFQVIKQVNPHPQQLRSEIERFFVRDRSPDDVLLFYFTGHGALDNATGTQLYLSTCETHKEGGRLVESSAVESDWLHRHLINSRSSQKIVILDCCFSGAIANWLQKGEGDINFQRLQAQGTVVLASSSAFEASYLAKGSVADPAQAQSVYTRYLLEGIQTGAARQGKAEWITARDLHEYAKQRVLTEIAAAPEPQIIVVEKEGYQIEVAKAPKGDPKTEFRQFVAGLLKEHDGVIPDLEKILFEIERENLGVSVDDAQVILNEQQKPYVIRKQKLKRYNDAFVLALQKYGYPFSKKVEQSLKRIQQALGLTDADIEKIEAPILQDHEANNAVLEPEVKSSLEQSPTPAKTSPPSPLVENQQRPNVSSPAPTPVSVPKPTPLPTAQPNPAVEASERGKKFAELMTELQKSPVEEDPFLRQLQQDVANSDRFFRKTTADDSSTRRQLLKWLGLGGGGLVMTIIAGQMGRNRTVPPKAFPPALQIEPINTVRLDSEGNVAENLPTKDISYYDEDLGNGIGLRMAMIPEGEFEMGQTEAEKEELIRQVGEDNYNNWYADELPRRKVTVSSFFMGMTPVTQAQYEAVMGENPSNFKGDDRPVENVSWNDAIAFCQKLSNQTGYQYRLPSEAEWEYACRAGTTTPFFFGETITTDYANYRGTDRESDGKTYPGNYGVGPKGIYRQETTAVRSFPPNSFGLFDMHGNVWEWCQDLWHDNYQGAPTDEKAWEANGNEGLRLLRGGSWNFNPSFCRSAVRSRDYADDENYLIGFRVVCSSPRTL